MLHNLVAELSRVLSIVAGFWLLDKFRLSLCRSGQIIECFELMTIAKEPRPFRQAERLANACAAQIFGTIPFLTWTR